jgi:hypothetical protein
MSTSSREFAFTLPVGLVDAEGRLHREGVMRLATARDEIIPLADARVRHNPAYLALLLLGRVVTRLGTLDVSAEALEALPSADLAWLQSFYRRINAPPERGVNAGTAAVEGGPVPASAGSARSDALR